MTPPTLPSFLLIVLKTFGTVLVVYAAGWTTGFWPLAPTLIRIFLNFTTGEDWITLGAVGRVTLAECIMAGVILPQMNVDSTDSRTIHFMAEGIFLS